MTSSFVTADTRSERFVAKHDARGWVRTVGRIGIASRGVIYLLLAYLAFDIARHGSAPTQTSSTGALQELEARTGGKLLLVVLAIGLGCYAVWRLFDVVTGANGAMRRVSSLAVGIIYGVLVYPGGGACCRSSDEWRRLEQSTASGWRRSWAGPVGPWRSKSPAVASWQRAWDWRHGASSTATTRTWPWSAYPVRGKRAIRLLGGFGDLARGSLLALFGVYLIEAGADFESSSSKERRPGVASTGPPPVRSGGHRCHCPRPPRLSASFRSSMPACGGFRDRTLMSTTDTAGLLGGGISDDRSSGRAASTDADDAGAGRPHSPPGGRAGVERRPMSPSERSDGPSTGETRSSSV